MSLGFEQAGFDVVCAIERDPAHAGAHRFNFPDCELVQDDIARVDADRLIAAVAAGLARTRLGRLAPRVDVVIGGPPCQGFSVGGLRDPRDPATGSSSGSHGQSRRFSRRPSCSKTCR